MSKYIVYNIKALEDLKFSKTNSQLDSEETMEYIPGSTIRGAYIYKYIVKNKIKDINKGIHRYKLLNGGIKFLNAYPKHKEKRSIPFPKVYYSLKENLKNYKDSLEIKSGLDINLESGYQRVKLSEFVANEKSGYIKINIEKNSNLHINKMKGQKNNKLFRYEYIKRGQDFQGIIKVENKEYIEEVKELFEGNIVYLGGSKGSGYGKCKIMDMEVLDYNPEYKDFNTDKEFEQDLYLLALSDIVYRTELGEYKSFISEEFIGKNLNLEEVRLTDSSIEIKNITNFNNKWNCSTPNIKAIKKGSVFKYSIKGKIDKFLLEKFIDRGIGDRRLDGFGRFVILKDIEDSYINEVKYAEDKYDYKFDTEDFSIEEKLQLQNIIDIIYKKRLETSIAKTVIQIDKDIFGSKNMNQNQWGNFKDLFDSLSYENSIEGIEKYNNYIKHIKTKRSTSFKQINKLKYKDKKLLDFFDENVKSSTDLEKFNDNKKIKKVCIGDLVSEIDKEFLYTYNMKILRELCRYEIRKEEI